MLISIGDVLAVLRFLRSMGLGYFFLIFLMSGLVLPALALEKPILSLDTGGHMALIRSVLFTPDGKQIVSSADDKKIRVWDIASGRTVRTFRGQIGDGNRGKIYALALSRDGKFLAAGGRMREAGEGTHPIRLYDFRNGDMIALLDAHQGAVLSLEFSPDGRFLVSGSTDDNAIIWDVGGRAVLHRLRGHKADINKAVFTRDGERVITGSDDRTMRLWKRSSGALIARSKKHFGNIFGLAISPVTGNVASSTQNGEVRISNDRTLRRVRKFQRQKGDIMGLSFSPDGKRLLSGTGTAPYKCLVWEIKRKTPKLRYGGHDQLVLATAISPRGDLAATAGGSNNEIHIWNMTTGRLVKKLRGTGKNVWSVGFAKDGQSIVWGQKLREKSFNNRGKLQYVLRLPEKAKAMGEPRSLEALSDKKQDKRSFRRAVMRLGRTKLKRRAGGDYGYYAHIQVTRRKKRRVTIRRDEKSGFAHNAITLTPDAQEVITGGGNGWLTAFGVNGRKRGDFIGHTSEVWAVAVSKGGRLLLSGSNDQTVRLWNVASRENIISLFYGRDGEWIIWTPQGYYAASPGGDLHVGWHINQGEDKAARFISAAQLKRHFYRPDIIRRALELASSSEAVRQSPGTDFALDELLTRRPPVFAVDSPKSGAKIGSSPVIIDLRIGDNIDVIEGYDVTVNGRRVILRSQGSPAGRNSKRHTVSFEVPLSTGENLIEIVAFNAIGKMQKQINVEYTGRSDLDKRGTLRVLAIGVDKYRNFTGQDLDFAEVDASAIRDMLLKSAGPLHEAVKSQLLAHKGWLPPTADNIRAALKDLIRSGPRDTIIVFMAGHGINKGQDYLFLPSNAAIDDEGEITAESTISWRDIFNTLEAARGQRILLLDTCYSGNAYNPRLIKDAADGKIAVLTATDAETLAQEDPELGHGIFTHSLLKGLKGAADNNEHGRKDGRVQMGELSEFVKKLVRKITGGNQTPTAFMSSGRFFTLSGKKARAKAISP
ncbi:MAG: hypothetical protein GY927_01970 [bacterium]|nr:hypothetical protein [bacterium]